MIVNHVMIPGYACKYILWSILKYKTVHSKTFNYSVSVFNLLAYMEVLNIGFEKRPLVVGQCLLNVQRYWCAFYYVDGFRKRSRAIQLLDSVTKRPDVGRQGQKRCRSGAARWWNRPSSISRLRAAFSGHARGVTRCWFTQPSVLRGHSTVCRACSPLPHPCSYTIRYNLVDGRTTLR